MSFCGNCGKKLDQGQQCDCKINIHQEEVDSSYTSSIQINKQASSINLGAIIEDIKNIQFHKPIQTGLNMLRNNSISNVAQILGCLGILLIFIFIMMEFELKESIQISLYTLIGMFITTYIQNIVAGFLSVKTLTAKESLYITGACHIPIIITSILILIAIIIAPKLILCIYTGGYAYTIAVNTSLIKLVYNLDNDKAPLIMAISISIVLLILTIVGTEISSQMMEDVIQTFMYNNF